MRLDLREDALRAGVIVPGKPGDSPLIERIGSEEPKKVMPPPKTRKTLSAAQKELPGLDASEGRLESPPGVLEADRAPRCRGCEPAHLLDLRQLRLEGRLRREMDQVVVHRLEDQHAAPTKHVVDVWKLIDDA